MAVVGRVGSNVIFAFLAAALFLGTLPQANGLAIESTRLTWNGFEVVTIAPNADLPGVNAEFTLSSDFSRCFETPGIICKFTLDTDGLDALDGKMVDIRDPQRCRRNGTSITCTSVAATLRTTDGQVRIRYRGQAGLTTDQFNGEISIPLTLDNTTPSVASIRTGACPTDNGPCYIAANVPSPITVTFTDTLTSFDWRLVFVGRDGAAGTRAQECAGNTCTVSLITPCQDGQEFTLALTRSGILTSKEDAQNTVAPHPGQRVVCKTRGPSITNLTITADGIAGQAVSGGTLTATAHVTGGIGDVSALVETRGILGENATNHTVAGACSPASGGAAGALDCAWTLGPLRDGTFTLAFKAIDGLGLYSTREQRVTVLRLIAGGPNGTGAPDLLRANVTGVTPESINRMALDLARQNRMPYPVYAQYRITARSPSVRIHEQELVSCAWRASEGTNWTETPPFFSAPPESHVFRPHADANETNRLDLQIRADRQVLSASDTFEVRCAVDMVVQEGTSLYEAPERENLTFTIRLRETALGQPGQAFVDKIKREEKKLKGGDQKLLLTLREIRSTLDGVCSIMEGFNTLSTTGSSIEMVGAGLESSGYFGPIGVLLEQIGFSTKEVGENVKEAVWQKGGKEGFLKKVCKQVTCSDLDRTKDGDLFNGEDFAKGTFADDSGFAGGIQGAGGGNAMFADVVSNLTTPNVEDSFIMSALHMCVGGMIYNAGKWQDINCGYLECLKEQSLNGQSTAVCEQAKSYKLCTQFVGEIFELPFLRVVKNLAENINGIIQNLPAYLLKWATNSYCESARHEPVTGPNWGAVGCHLLDAVTGVTDFQQSTRRGFNAPMDDSGICLQAMCSEEDRRAGKCKTSFNRVEQYSKYAEYLDIATWMKDKKAVQREDELARTQAAFKDVDGYWREQTGDEDATYIDYYITREGAQYTLTSTTNPSQSTTFVNARGSSLEGIEPVDPALLDNADYTDFRSTLDYGGVILRDEQDLAEYRASSAMGEQRFTDVAKLLAKRDACQEAGEDCSSYDQQLKDKGIQANGEDLIWTSSSTSIPQEAIDACAGKSVCTHDVGSATYAFHEDGSIVRMTGTGDTTTGTLVGYRTDEQEAEAIAKATRARQTTATFDLVASVAVKIALDKGYLDWLSTSYWGDWDITQQSEQYLTKEGWAENLCNDLKFDINDNDDGAIYVTDADAFPRPVGTFAAEIQETMDADGRKTYLYLITILIDNPVRSPPFGVSPGEFADRNHFRVDAALTGGDAEPFDLINGTFDLAMGKKLGDQDGPKRALFTLPQRYERLCITFDEPFPDANGERTYCREVLEDAYDRGSPVPPQATQNGGSGNPNSGSGSGSGSGSETGCIYGSVSGC